MRAARKRRLYMVLFLTVGVTSMRDPASFEYTGGKSEQKNEIRINAVN